MPRIVILAAACLLLAAIAAQGQRAVVDEAAFADRAAHALERPDVRTEVAARLRFANPDVPAAAIAAAVADPRFEPSFRRGAARMHHDLFAGTGRVTLDVGSTSLVTLGGGGPLERGLRRAAPAAGRLAAFWPAALVLGLALLALAVARSPRRGLRGAGLAVAAAGGAAAAITIATELVLLRTFTTAHGDAVVDAIWDGYLADLRTWGLIAIAGGLALAAATPVLNWRWPSPEPAGARAAASSPAGSGTSSPR